VAQRFSTVINDTALKGRGFSRAATTPKNQQQDGDHQKVTK
jgi:hypothetical protein